MNSTTINTTPATTTGDMRNDTHSNNNSAMCHSAGVMKVPSATDLFNDFPLEWSIVVAVGLLSTLINILIYINVAKHVRNYVKSKARRQNLYLLSGLFPVYCILSFVTVIAPRSTAFCQFISSNYLALSLYQYHQLMLGHLGENKAERVADMADLRLPLQSPPVTCCLCCLPSVRVTRARLRALQLMVFQYVLVNPIVTGIGIVFLIDQEQYVADMTIDLTNINVYPLAIAGLSTMTAITALIMLHLTTRKALVQYRTNAQFIFVQLVLLLSSLLGLILSSVQNIFGVFDSITDTYKMVPLVFLSEILNMVLVVVMLLLSVVSRRFWMVKIEENQNDTVLIYRSPSMPSACKLSVTSSNSKTSINVSGDDNGQSLSIGTSSEDGVYKMYIN